MGPTVPDASSPAPLPAPPATPHGTSRALRTLRTLQARITSGEWPLNSRIPTERELVEQLGVGRSTVREAVRTLANMGMLEPAPSRGTFVRSLTPVSTVLSEFMAGRGPAELVEARVAIEVEAARLAAARRTEADLAALRASHRADLAASSRDAPGRDGEGDGVRGSTPGQFHALVLRAAASPLLAQMHAGVMAGLRQAQARGTVRAGIDDATRQADHEEQLAALEAGDVERSGVAARHHVERDLVVVADPEVTGAGPADG